MASEDERCFTLMWKMENLSYGWFDNEYIESPEFIVNEISNTNWKLRLNLNIPSIERASCLSLRRLPDVNDKKKVEIDYDLAIVLSDGKVQIIQERKNAVFQEKSSGGYISFLSWSALWFERKSMYFAQDLLTVRCRMWKRTGEISKNVQCIARTRITVEKRSTIWNIEDFSHLEPEELKIYKIKSLSSNEQLMTLKLWFPLGQITDETICLNIIPNYNKIKTSTLKLSIVDAYNNTEKCLLGQFANYEDVESKKFTTIYSKKELLERQKTYLQNDILSLLCECSYSFGKFEYEIEFKSSNFLANGKTELPKKNEPAKDILINDFKWMLNDSEFADIKLQTRSKTYPAHKIILAARSPVFKSMFSNNMTENGKDCFGIDDFSDETVLDMLRFIYCAEVENLVWDRAIRLYEAADKYQILNLKDICASFIKANLHFENVCDALVLADIHQDQDLKRFVQDFVLKDGDKIINSEEWRKLMENHLKLAAETMHLKFKVSVNKNS